MIRVSDIKTTLPEQFKTQLQEQAYKVLRQLSVPFERVETDEVITMEDCAAVNRKMNMKMVKTLFLCNRRQTEFYLFVTCGEKPFSSKKFSTALGISRVSFAPVEKMESMLKTKIGAATVFSALADTDNNICIVFDREAINEKYYGCSDGTTTGYLKIKTADIIDKFLPFSKHTPVIIEV